MKSELPTGPVVLAEPINKKNVTHYRTFEVDEHGNPSATIFLGEVGNLVTTHLLGRMLTILDASIADTRQCKAAKDITKHMMWEAFSQVRSWMCENADRNGMCSDFPFSDDHRSME